MQTNPSTSNDPFGDFNDFDQFDFKKSENKKAEEKIESEGKE